MCRLPEESVLVTAFSPHLPHFHPPPPPPAPQALVRDDGSLRRPGFLPATVLFFRFPPYLRSERRHPALSMPLSPVRGASRFWAFIPSGTSKVGRSLRLLAFFSFSSEAGQDATRSGLRPFFVMSRKLNVHPLSGCRLFFLINAATIDSFFGSCFLFKIWERERRTPGFAALPRLG